MRKERFVRTASLLLAILLLVPCTAYAAAPETVMPLASDYINFTRAYVCAVGGGDVQVWFRVEATNDWEDVGALRVELYEATEITKWTLVETYSCEDYSNMLVHDYDFCMSHVDYEGTAGKYYKAYVTLWAGNGSTGDTRYIWTPAVLAT